MVDYKTRWALNCSSQCLIRHLMKSMNILHSGKFTRDGVICWLFCEGTHYCFFRNQSSIKTIYFYNFNTKFVSIEVLPALFKNLMILLALRLGFWKCMLIDIIKNHHLRTFQNKCALLHFCIIFVGNRFMSLHIFTQFILLYVWFPSCHFSKWKWLFFL